MCRGIPSHAVSCSVASPPGRRAYTSTVAISVRATPAAAPCPHTPPKYSTVVCALGRVKYAYCYSAEVPNHEYLHIPDRFNLIHVSTANILSVLPFERLAWVFTADYARSTFHSSS